MTKASVITFNGLSLTVPQWAQLLGMSHAALRSRLANLDWSIERALLEPVYLGKRPYRHGERYRHKNETKTIREWAEQAGIAPQTLNGRLRLGWTMSQAINTPPMRKTAHPCPNPITYDGVSLSVPRWAARVGMRSSTLRNRIMRGWTVKEALTTPTNVPRLRTLTGDELTPIRSRTTTGGYDQTSPNTLGTGVGSSARDLQSRIGKGI